MKKVLNWIRRYWMIPFLVLGSILAWIIFKGRRPTPIAQTKRELEAIDAGRRAGEMEARYGALVAVANVKHKYQEELDALDEKKRNKARELWNDPQKLAKFLVRAGSVHN